MIFSLSNGYTPPQFASFFVDLTKIYGFDTDGTMVSFFACILRVVCLSVLFAWPILREVLLSFDCCAAFFEKTI